jgi:hypothetical protein
MIDVMEGDRGIKCESDIFAFKEFTGLANLDLV